MKSKFIQGSMILALFVVLIVDPFSWLPTSLNEMHYGIIHPSSLLFIVMTALVLFFSIDTDIQKAHEEHQKDESSIKETVATLENYFEDQIMLEELMQKAQNNKIISKMVHLIYYGVSEDDLSLSVDKIFTHISSKYVKLKSEYEYIATVLPIIGMVGTIAGLLIMFAAPSGIEDFEEKFAGLSIALATTLYASLMTVLIFKPKARSVEEWLVDLDTDHDYFDIAIKQFIHKVDLMELSKYITQDQSAQTDSYFKKSR